MRFWPPKPVWAPPELPVAAVRAFSIDDATTTEIDDAFSVTELPDGQLRIGIHIAAPALGFARGSALDAIARRRLSTVYMPGNKITMLPDEIVQTFTLGEGRDCPAVSLYLDITPGLAIVGEESRVELVPIVANLRHHDIEPVFNDDTVHNGGPDFQWKRELTLLWDLATVLEANPHRSLAQVQQAAQHSALVDHAPALNGLRRATIVAQTPDGAADACRVEDRPYLGADLLWRAQAATGHALGR